MCSFQEIVRFLQEFKAVDIFTGVIAKSKAPRATVSQIRKFTYIIIFQDGKIFSVKIMSFTSYQIYKCPNKVYQYDYFQVQVTCTGDLIL